MCGFVGFVFGFGIWVSRVFGVVFRFVYRGFFLLYGWVIVYRDAVGCCVALIVGFNCVELYSIRVREGMFWEICIIFMILNLRFLSK